MLNSEICELTFLRIEEIVKEYDNKTSWQTNFVSEKERLLADFFAQFYANRARYLMFVKEVCGLLEGGFDSVELSTLKELNEKAFIECRKDNYETSFANPEYIYNCLSAFLDEKEAGKLSGIISFLYAEIQALYTKAFTGEEFTISVVSQLFLECFGISFEDEEIDNKIKTLQSFIDKMEDLINELVIHLSSNKEDNDDINNLFKDMDDLIGSVKDY